MILKMYFLQPRLVSKPSARARQECVLGENRPEPSPFLDYYFFFPASSAAELNSCSLHSLLKVFHAADFQTAFLFLFLSFHRVPLTEAASRAIVQFLEINQSEEASRGWMLLTTINLLASSGQVRLKQQCLMIVAGLETHKNHNFEL